jgi:hypothetical protein
LRGTTPTARAARRPGAQARQARVRAALVDEDEGRRVERGHLHPPGGTDLLVALAGRKRLFLSGHPSRANARDIVAALTRTPCSRSQRAQCSVSVASGMARTWDSSAASWAGPMRRERPRRGNGATLPRVRCRRAQRSIVAVLTPKRRAASAWLRPASMAPSSRSRRSTEYGFIPGSIARHHLFCKTL